MRPLTSILALAIALLAACQPEATSGTASAPETAAFPQFSPSGESMEALVDGRLVLDGRCLRLQVDHPTSGAGAVSYLVVWPAQASLDADATPLRVTDAQSGVVASVGQRTTLSGGEVRDAAPDASSLATPIPTVCHGPYWLAGGIVQRDAALFTPDTAPLTERVTVAVLDTPPVDDIGYHREPLAEGPSAFRAGGVLYVDATALAGTLGVPALATAEPEPGRGDAVVRDGRRYATAEVVGRVAGAFVYDHGPGQGVSVIPRAVLPAVHPRSPIGIAAQEAGFDVLYLAPGDTGY